MINKESIKKHLKHINLLYGVLHEQAWEFVIWPSENMDEWNEGYCVEECLPGYYAIGSDGGLEMLTVEMATGIIYAIPFIPMEINNRVKVADTLEDLINNKNNKHTPTTE